MYKFTNGIVVFDKKTRDEFLRAGYRLVEETKPVEKTDDVIKEDESVISDESTDIPTNKYYRKSKVKKVKDDGVIE